jgi:ABC-type multidrug transport system fused ATPase/permease subunit
LARAKNTQRSQARRQHRAELRANTLSDDAYLDDDDSATVEPETQVTSRRPLSGGGLGSMFHRPDIRGDLRAMPGLLRTQKRLWIPFVALLAGFAIDAAFFWGYLSADANSIAILAFTLILSPQALFVPFIAGFLAPRGAYLLGALVGLFDAILITILFAGPVQADRGANLLATSGLGDIVAIFVVAILFATFAAAFASWYRGFLRTSQERAKVNRMLREEQQAAKRKEEERTKRLAEREARRTTSTRKSTP